MRAALIILFLVMDTACVRAQQAPDTLDAVVVNVYGQQSRLLNIAAPVSVTGRSQLKFGNELSVVGALNALPGVNMEERSPGSYRMNIRGSSQRSPFGVRNVKVYYQGMPMTDPGGNTYLQILGPYNMGKVEVLKGPSGSMYGTGTGGVLLISDVPSHTGVDVSAVYGSHNTQNFLVSGSRVTEKGKLNIKFNHQNSDGYRHHTAMRRNVVALNSEIASDKNFSVAAHILYGDLYYQTPGALMRNEYKNDPYDARPHVGSAPSADEARAAFYLNYVLAGLRIQQKLSAFWDHEMVVYGAYGQNRNPNFRNYSRTSEPHAGARVNFHYDKKKQTGGLIADLGAEYQFGSNGQRVFKNIGGQTGDLQTDDEINSKQAFAYAQVRYNFRNDWAVTFGSSLNFLSVRFQRFSDNGYRHHRDFNGLWMPRVAVSKSFGKHTLFYSSVSRGFSPPSTSELLPSTDIFDTRLQAEHGMNYEIGYRQQALAGRLFADVSIFHFGMHHTIVQERDSTGGDYFINAGSTSQKGAEALVRYHILGHPRPVVHQLTVTFSATVHDFKFLDYKPVDKNYSGNQLPGTSPVKLTADFAATFSNGISLRASSIYRSRIALDDANTAYADAYDVVNVRADYNFGVKNIGKLTLFAGSENITNTRYSLGNDINAFGGRYYNAAPRRTFYVGISSTLFDE